MMNGKQLALLYKTVQDYNILPVTTTCNVRCMFCSHHQNPPEVQAVSLPPLEMDLVKDLMTYLDGKRKIIIGESTSLIMEGEPFTHKYFLKILTELRDKFPQTVIQITTNGTFLTKECIVGLKALEPITLILSLNSADTAKRRYLMNDLRAVTACQAPKLLQEAKITYHGSIVAMPHILGWADLEATVRVLHEFGAQTIRLFKPGFTQWTSSYLVPDNKVFEELEQRVSFWQQEGVPITLEPMQLKNLQAIVAGVIAHSPASFSGIKSGDLILEIDGRQPFSRADAFEKLQKAGKYQLKIKRLDKIMYCVLDNQKGFSGLIFNYDLSLGEYEKMNRFINSRPQQFFVQLCSELAYPLWKQVLQNKNIVVYPVKSYFFGGNIQAAGLLTIADFQKALADFEAAGGKYDIVLLPRIAFDDFDNDLAGENLTYWQEQIDAEIILM